MEFHFTLQIRPSTRWPLDALKTLLSIECQTAEADSLVQFLSAAKVVNPEHGERLAQGFIRDLDKVMGEDFRAEGVGLYTPYLADGSLVFSFVYGDPTVAAILAEFLGFLCPGLDFEARGDYDEDPYGFRYGYKDGQYFQEEGFLMDDEYQDE
ncbi:MAG: hypothetical protein ABWY06_02415 [Pseudomonas sp.]|uniref:hypothetical protein n=1 Tax=Pseudomonas sp. TaxID=306 RepID=UPI003399E1FE